MILYGNIFFSNEFVFCGHPRLSMDIYRFKVDTPGLYDVFVKEEPNDLNKPESVLIQITTGVEINQNKGQLIQSGLSNECHGGVMICSSEKFSELGSVFENNHSDKLWNYFANGICLKQPWIFESWKSNSPDGNIVFVPSDEYYNVFKCRGGYLIECNADFNE